MFHGSKESIWDSLKYCFADASIDYMQFLEECRKAEEEGKAGQAKVKVKVKAAATTLPPTKDDELSRQLKYQQHQIDAWVGQVKDVMSVVKATQPSSKVARTWFPSYGRGAYGTRTSSPGRGGSWRKDQSSQPGATPQSKSRNPSKDREKMEQRSNTNVWQCGEVGHLKRLPYFKR